MRTCLRRTQLQWIVAAASLVFCAVGLLAQEPIDVSAFLPEGARTDSLDEHIVFADLDLDGADEVVVFFVHAPEDHPGTTILVLECQVETCAPRWRDVERDSSVEFLPISGVWTLQEGRRPQIVAHRLVGASCGGLFQIFEARDNSVAEVSGDWEPCQREVELRDLDGNGTVEILLDRERPGIPPAIFTWRGGRFVSASEEFPRYFDRHLEPLLRSFEKTDEEYPVSAWLQWYEEARKILELQGEVDRAITLSKRFALMLEEARYVQGSQIELDIALSRVHSRLSELHARRAKVR